MLPMVLALLIAITTAGGGTRAMPDPGPGYTAHQPETPQAQRSARQTAGPEELDRAPGLAKSAAEHAAEPGDAALAVAPRTPASTLPLASDDSPRPSAALSTTTALTLTQTISNVVALADDPLVRGQSYRGLLAKLEAAGRALDRGQAPVAVHVLDAFNNQLDAFRRSGHISPANYDDLFSRYSALAATLSGVARERTGSPHGRDAAAGADAAPSPGRRGESGKAAQPTSRTPDAKGPKHR